MWAWSLKLSFFFNWLVAEKAGVEVEVALTRLEAQLKSTV